MWSCRRRFHRAQKPVLPRRRASAGQVVSRSLPRMPCRSGVAWAAATCSNGKHSSSSTRSRPASARAARCSAPPPATPPSRRCAARVAVQPHEREPLGHKRPPADRHDVVHGDTGLPRAPPVVTSADHPLAARSRVTLDEVGRLAALLLRRWWHQRSRRELEALGKLPEPVLELRSRWPATPCSRAMPRRSSRPASLRTRSPPVRSYRCKSSTCQQSCVRARSSSTRPPTPCHRQPERSSTGCERSRRPVRVGLIHPVA
jgi:hypothetical protein